MKSKTSPNYQSSHRIKQTLINRKTKRKTCCLALHLNPHLAREKGLHNCNSREEKKRKTPTYQLRLHWGLQHF